MIQASALVRKIIVACPAIMYCNHSFSLIPKWLHVLVINATSPATKWLQALVYDATSPAAKWLQALVYDATSPAAKWLQALVYLSCS
jgi:hypothetical protein